MGAPRDFADWIRLVERNQVALRGISGTIADAVTAITVEQQTKDARHPTAPIELVAQTGLYTDTAGRSRVRLVLDFPDVIKATDGTSLTATGYELWGKDVSATALDLSTSAVPGLAVPGLTLPGLAATPANKALQASRVKDWALLDTAAVSAFRTDGFIPGSIWLVKARALAGTLTPGEFSIEVRVPMLEDTVPPPQPTKPVLDVARGTITATWDGLAVTGPMPADFSYAILAAGSASSPVQEVARFGRQGGFKVTANMPYFTPQFYRLQAVDESGNRSPWSEQAVGYTTPLVDTDVILSTIDGAKTYLKNIDAGVAILPNTIFTKHLVVTEDMTAALAKFLHVKAGMLEANEIWADTAWFGVADAKLVRSDMFEGKAFMGGTFTTTPTGRFQSHVEEYKGVKLAATGLKGWNGSGVETFALDAATGNVTIGGGTFTGGKFQSSSFPNTGVKLDPSGLKIWNTSGQLVLDAGPSGATFTGTIRSGFGSSYARLSENIFDGRPGFQLGTGGTYLADPFMIAYAANDAYDYRRGGAYVSAAWEGGGSDPGRLFTQRNGDFSLRGGGMAVTGSSGQVRLIESGGDPAELQVGGGSGNALLKARGAYGGTGSVTCTASGVSVSVGLTVSGAKNFVMDHPTKPGMELLHGATESPVSGVEYWGCGTVGADGTGSIALPEYFTALTKPGSVCIGVWGNGAQVSWSNTVVGNRVAVTGPAGTGYMWLVKAERTGADFPVERMKVQWTPHG